jgi:hypothetical protein
VGGNNVFQELAETARCLIVALFVCLSAVISSAPVGAVPIARGLPTLATVIDETSPQHVGPISFVEWVSKDDSANKAFQVINPFGVVDPDGFWAVAIEVGAVNVSPH